MSNKEILTQTYAPSFEYRKLPPIFKANWIAALKSKKYKQGRTALAENIEGKIQFDPLGVAARVCEIGADHLLDKKDLIVLKTKPSKKALKEWNALLEKRIPHELRTNKALNNHLNNLNDTYGFNFAAIADWIKKYL